MMKFDLTPLVTGSYRKFLLFPFLAGFMLALIAGIFLDREIGLGLFRGAVLGILDGMLLLLGVRKALPYVETPKQGVRVMRRYGTYRLLAIASIIILLLKQGFNVAFVFVGLLLMHIFFIINLTFIAYRLSKGGDAKKGVWQNGK
ncbi:MAG: hypothetical protein ABS965_03675 [Succiniclasticum sp.]|jgi:hypothetical protein